MCVEKNDLSFTRPRKYELENNSLHKRRKRFTKEATMETMARGVMQIIGDHRLSLCRQWLGSNCSLNWQEILNIVSRARGGNWRSKVHDIGRIRFKLPQSAFTHILNKCVSQTVEAIYPSTLFLALPSAVIGKQEIVQKQKNVNFATILRCLSHKT